MTRIRIETRERTITEAGVWLTVPEDAELYEWLRGERVFVTAVTLEELANQGEFESQFGSALLLGPAEGLALVAAGLAVQETRGGYHGTGLVRTLLDNREI